MIARRVYGLLLIALLAVNTWSGVGKVMGFRHLHRAEKALTEVDMNVAMESLAAALRWQPGDSTMYVLIGRAIHIAQGSQLPIEGLKGRPDEEVLKESVGAVGWGIALNPADAWAWHNLAEAYLAFQSARGRIEELMASIEAAMGGKAPAAPSEARKTGGLKAEDPFVVGAALMAMDLEPGFYFYHDFLARLYWDRGLKDEAAREIRESYALWPTGRIDSWIRNPEFMREMAGSILEGIERADSNPFIDPLVVARARADLLERVGPTEDAIGALARMKEVGGAAFAPECDLRVAKILQTAGRYRESLPILQKLRADYPDQREAVGALFYLGVAHSKLSEHKEAVKYLREYVTRGQGSVQIFFALADSLEALGEDAEAERMLRAAVARAPGDPSPCSRLISLLKRHRRFPEALEQAERFRDRNPGDPAAERLFRQVEAGQESRGP